MASPAAIASAGLVALAIAMGIGRFAFTPILPMMQQEAGLSVSEGGWLASANYFGFLIGAMSAVGVRISATLAIRAGLVVIGLVTLAMAFVQQFEIWFALRAIAGFANAWAQIFTFAWSLDRLTAGGRPLLSGVVFGGAGVGIAIAGIYCLVLMQVRANFAEAWLGLGTISLIATASVWYVFNLDKSSAAYKDRPPTTSRLRINGTSLRIVLCFGASGFGYIIPATFLPAMARQLVPDPLIFGWSWPVFGIATALAPLFAARWLQRFGNRRVWMISHLIMAVGVGLPACLPTIGGIMVAALLVGSTFMVNGLASMQEAKKIAGPHATALMAATTAAFATGQIIGPICVSYISGSEGGFAAPLLIAAVVLVVSAIALAYRFTEQEQPA